jgi:hypothetical protein
MKVPLPTRHCIETTSPTNVQRAYYGPSDTCVERAPGRVAAISRSTTSTT